MKPIIRLELVLGMLMILGLGMFFGIISGRIGISGLLLLAQTAGIAAAAGAYKSDLQKRLVCGLRSAFTFFTGELLGASLVVWP